MHEPSQRPSPVARTSGTKTATTSSTPHTARPTRTGRRSSVRSGGGGGLAFDGGRYSGTPPVWPVRERVCWDGAMADPTPPSPAVALTDPSPRRRTALVTGASSGIGAATVRALAAAGFATVAAARRVEHCEELAREVGGRALALDVTDDASVAALAAAVPEVDVVVHSAGGAFGTDRVEDGDVEGWRRMYDVNVLGVLRVHKALLPAMRRGGDAHVVVLGSIAGFETYPGGGGYTAVKHSVNALCRTMRQEMLGEPVRVTEIAPGMVETEFSVVRLGDAEAAAKVYEGVTPLSAQDVAEVIAFAVTRPPHVDLDRVVVRPVQQADAAHVHRRR